MKNQEHLNTVRDFKIPGYEGKIRITKVIGVLRRDPKTKEPRGMIKVYGESIGVQIESKLFNGAAKCTMKDGSPLELVVLPETLSKGEPLHG